MFNLYCSLVSHTDRASGTTLLHTVYSIGCAISGVYSPSYTLREPVSFSMYRWCIPVYPFTATEYVGQSVTCCHSSGVEPDKTVTQRPSRVYVLVLVTISIFHTSIIPRKQKNVNPFVFYFLFHSITRITSDFQRVYPFKTSINPRKSLKHWLILKLKGISATSF